MKLTVLKSVAGGMLSHINTMVRFGDNQIFKNLPKDIDTNILEKKDDFDKYCLDFFKKRVPKSFDMKRIQEFKLVGARTISSFKLSAHIKIDDKILSTSVAGFTYQ